MVDCPDGRMNREKMKAMFEAITPAVSIPVKDKKYHKLIKDEICHLNRAFLEILDGVVMYTCKGLYCCTLSSKKMYTTTSPSQKNPENGALLLHMCGTPFLEFRTPKTESIEFPKTEGNGVLKTERFVRAFLSF